MECRKENGLALSGAAFGELLTAVLAKKKPFRFTARGMSMSPFIKDGDRITVSPFVGRRRPRTGDIAAVISPATGNLLVHRIVRLNGHTCRIKGDNTPAPDGLFPTGSLLGFVSHLERGCRRIEIRPGMGNILVALISRLGLIPRILSITNAFRLFLRYR